MKSTTNKETNLDRSLKLIVKTSFIVFIGLVISKILAYAYRIIIARYFGPEVYGLFMLALTIVSFFATIVAFGLADGLLRYISYLRAKDKKGEIKYLLNFTIKYSIIAGIIGGVILFFLSDFIAIELFKNIQLSILIKILSATVIIYLLSNTFLALLRAYEEISCYSLIYNILQNVFRVSILIILILLGFSSGASPVVLSFALASILLLITSYFFARYKIKSLFEISEKKNTELRKELISYSWPIMLYGIFGLILYWIDSFSLGFFKSAVEVGIYNAAVPIAMLIGIIPEIFMQLFFPLINREYSSKNYKLIEQLSKQVTKWIFMVALPIFILIFFFPGAALNILFGAEYLPAENALRFLLIGAFISALFVVSNNLISMLGKSKLVLINITFAAFLNLVLNAFLVPMPFVFNLDNSKGLVGAATATLISMIFLNLLFMVQTKKYLSFIPLRRKMITIALISLIPTALLFWLRSTLALNIFLIILLAAIFIIVYGILLLVSGSLDENDWMIIKAVLRKIYRK